MFVLAFMIVAAMVMAMLAAGHCLVWDSADPACVDKKWGELIRDAISDWLPVIVAIIMSRRARP